MSRKLKTAEKYCEYCGKKLERKVFASGRLEDYGVFLRRKYCNRTCMRKAFLKIGENTEQTNSNAHTTARGINELILQKNQCEECGKTGRIDVHHIDGNCRNNTPKNLMALCRSCHMKKHKEKGMCVVCGKPAKGHGFCNKHYLRYRKYGNPMIIGKCNGQLIESEN